MSPTPLRTGGVVLCGGRSTRMGRPKAWLPFGGEPLLVRVVRLLGAAVDPVVVVAAVGQDLPPLPARVVVVRDAEDGRGPLQGLVAGLTALGGRADAAFVTACDAPFLDPRVVRRVAELLGEFEACVPETGGRRHPLTAVYRVGIVDAVLGVLATGRGRATALSDRVRTRLVGPHELADLDPDFRSMRNLNTPEEYESACRETGHPGPPPTDRPLAPDPRGFTGRAE